MLLVYTEPFVQAQMQLLYAWSKAVHYWPRSYVHTDAYNAAIPIDWYLLFMNPYYADLWLLKYPERSLVIRVLD